MQAASSLSQRLIHGFAVGMRRDVKKGAGSAMFCMPAAYPSLYSSTDIDASARVWIYF